MCDITLKSTYARNSALFDLFNPGSDWSEDLALLQRVSFGINVWFTPYYSVETGQVTNVCDSDFCTLDLYPCT